MEFADKIDIAGKLLDAVALGRRVPLLICWNGTYRCNLQCPYCGAFRRCRDYLVPTGGRFAEAFSGLSLPHECHRCWGGQTVELAQPGRLRPDAVWGVWRRFRARTGRE